MAATRGGGPVVVEVPTAPTLARRLADVMEAASIPYAIGGALALGVWGFPRATNDVDLDIFLVPNDLMPALEALQRAGFGVDTDAALSSARERGDFTIAWQGMRVDVFVASIPFYDTVRQRVRRATLESRPASFLSAEDLATFKMLFFRAKDLIDLERLVSFMGPTFDQAYVRRWLVELVGADDERVQRWDRLTRDVEL